MHVPAALNITVIFLSIVFNYQGWSNYRIIFIEGIIRIGRYISVEVSTLQVFDGVYYVD